MISLEKLFVALRAILIDYVFQCKSIIIRSQNNENMLIEIFKMTKKIWYKMKPKKKLFSLEKKIITERF